MDQGRPGAAPQAAARPDLHPPERLQGADGEAPRGAELAAGGHGARGRLLPQAVHRLRRRQVGDQQEPGGRGAARVVLRAALRRGHGAGAGDPGPELRRRAGGARARTAAPVTRALARLGGQAAHAQPGGVHPRVQRLAGEHPQPRPRAGVRDQALPPAGVGRRLAGALRRGHHQRRAGARAQVRGAQAGRQLPPHRARRARRLAHLQAAAGLRRGRQGADGGRHHRLGRGPRAPPDRPPRRVRRAPEPQAGAELRVPAVPAARRRDPPGAGPPDRGGHGRPRALLLQLPAARPGGRAADPGGRGRPRRLHRRRCASTCSGTPPATARAGPSAPPGRGSSAASRPRTRATSSSAPTWPGPATATSPRSAPGSAGGCRSTSRCCSR